ncbi:MAG: TraR/DksA family transcriptional regulator [Nitriliruptoraceae bacterium]
MRGTMQRSQAPALEEERARLLSELDELRGQVASVCPGDLADLAEERMRLHGVALRRVAVERRLAELDGAIARLRRGSYGLCDVCGRTISTDRLEILPATTTCAAHAGRCERA